MPSPRPGAISTTVVSASPATSTSLWPTPTVSTTTTSNPAASRTRIAWGVVHASPPRWPGEAIDRMKTPGSVAWSCIRTRSPSSAPPENGDDGSTASTPTRRPAARSSVTRALVVVDLPTPGGPVMPTTCACPACGVSAAITCRSSGEPSSTIETSRPTARASPARARATRSSTLSALGDTHDQRVALAATTTQRGRADAAAAALELERECQHHAGAGHADGVAERDGAAVDVDLGLVDAERAGRGDADRGEGLVELDQVEVGGLDPVLLARLRRRVGRLQ